MAQAAVTYLHANGRVRTTALITQDAQCSAIYAATQLEAATRPPVEFVTGNIDGCLRFYSKQNVLISKTTKLHANGITVIRTSDCASLSNYVFAGSEDRTFTSYNLTRGELATRFRGHTAGVMDLLIAPRYALSASRDKSVRMWDSRQSSGRHIDEYNGHTDSVACLCQLPSEPFQFLSGSADHQMKVWDIRNNASPLQTVTYFSNGLVSLHYGATTGVLLVRTADRLYSLSRDFVLLATTAQFITPYGEAISCRDIVHLSPVSANDASALCLPPHDGCVCDIFMTETAAGLVFALQVSPDPTSVIVPVYYNVKRKRAHSEVRRHYGATRLGSRIFSILDCNHIAAACVTAAE